MSDFEKDHENFVEFLSSLSNTVAYKKSNWQAISMIKYYVTIMKYICGKNKNLVEMEKLEDEMEKSFTSENYASC